MTKKDLLRSLSDQDCTYFSMGPSTYTPDGEAIHLVFHLKPGRSINGRLLSKIIYDLKPVATFSDGSQRWSGWILKDIPEGLDYSIMDTVTIKVSYELIS